MSQLFVNAGGSLSAFNDKFVNKQQTNLIHSVLRLITALVTKALEGVNEFLLIL
jgi:hypothetical protein